MERSCIQRLTTTHIPVVLGRWLGGEQKADEGGENYDDAQDDAQIVGGDGRFFFVVFEDDPFKFRPQSFVGRGVVPN